MTNTQTTAPDPNLCKVIAEIESSGSARALRFEPRVYRVYSLSHKSITDIVAAIHNCSHDTANVIAATSFGAYQIMGFNLYTFGYRKSIFDFVASVADQLEYFDAFLTRSNINFTLDHLLKTPHDLMRFAYLYNGSEVYARSIQTTAAKMGFV